MTKVFLCHANSDKRVARRLARDLERNGMDPWIDEAEIVVGESLLERIERGLSDADFVAVLLSPRAV